MKVVTYSWTVGNARNRRISLCQKHDTLGRRRGYGQVYRGQHRGACHVCLLLHRGRVSGASE